LLNEGMPHAISAVFDLLAHLCPTAAVQTASNLRTCERNNHTRNGKRREPVSDG
jgi:hypothetical protein